MGTVIQLDKYRDDWHEAFTADGHSSTLRVYVNKHTGELEVVQMNDEGEAIRTVFNRSDTLSMLAAISNALGDVGQD